MLSSLLSCGLSSVLTVTAERVKRATCFLWTVAQNLFYLNFSENTTETTAASTKKEIKMENRNERKKSL